MQGTDYECGICGSGTCKIVHVDGAVVRRCAIGCEDPAEKIPRKEAPSVQFSPAQPSAEQPNSEQETAGIEEGKRGFTGAESKVDVIPGLLAAHKAGHLSLPASIQIVRPKSELSLNVQKVLHHLVHVFALWVDSGKLRTAPLAYPEEDLAEHIYGDRKLFRPIVRNALWRLDYEGIVVLVPDVAAREGKYHPANLYVLVEPGEDSFEIELDPQMPTI